MIIKYLLLLLCYSIDKSTQQQSNCINPNQKIGNCISIYDCAALLKTVRIEPLPETDRKFLLESQCREGSGRQPYVCCTDDTGYTTNINVTPSSTTTNKPLQNNVTITPDNRDNLLPNTPICGKQKTDDRIYNGDDTAIDEFPWMALLEYISPSGQRVLNCGGSLINSRYVLTAAHCVTGAVERQVGKLVRVRLGEYDTSKEKDCVNGDCADSILEIDIEIAIPHEGFNDTTPDRHNDIALLRLKQNVPYTDFVRPICLPSVVNLQRATAGTDLTVAGWGRTLRARSSAVKQKLTIPIFNQEECAKKFITKKVQLADSQLCAGGQFAKDSCDGDSGGPLMRLSSHKSNKFWGLEGVVSFGNRCGLENWPAIYTRVSSHENWIRENLKP